MSTPGCCNSSTAKRTCISHIIHMAWLLTYIRLGRAANKRNTALLPMCPCGHVTSSSPQLYLPVMRHTTVGGMDGKSTTRFAAQGCISLRYCHTAILPYCHTATTIIPRHSRSVLQGIFSQINPVHLADASAILQRPLSYRVRHIGTDPAMSTPGCCNSSTAKRTCISHIIHMAWLLTYIRLGRAANKRNTALLPMCPCGHVTSSSPQLYLPVMRHTTVGGMDGKSTTRFAAQGCISLRYCTVPVMHF